MLDLRTNPASGRYFHRGGMLIALAVMFALTIGIMPVIGIVAGRRLYRVAEQDMTLIARGEMEPSGYTLAHAAGTVGRAIELASWATTACLVFGVALLAITR